MPPLPLASLESLPWVAIIAVGASMLLAVVGAVGGMIIAYHRQKQWHETARLALEKGQPLPASQDETPQSQQRQRTDGPGRDLRSGLILIASGAGLYLFFNALMGQQMAYLGAIPGFIGVALVLFAILSAIFKGKPASPAVHAAADEAALRLIAKVGRDAPPPADRP